MDNPSILKLLLKLHQLSCTHKTIHLCWIPSHICIRGNDLKPHINYFILNKWQERWSSCPDNKLFNIKPILGEWPSGFRNSHKEEVILSRLRIGHTYFLK